ncbi:MAG: hypothetical protein AAF383_03545 [Cyanobacteria bacterium P01_A01_bin.83]
MIEEKVRQRAREILSELMQLDTLATSQTQRREFKDALQYLQRAIKTGSNTALQLGSYHFVVVSRHIREVQEGKRKGAERARRKENNNKAIK